VTSSGSRDLRTIQPLLEAGLALDDVRDLLFRVSARMVNAGHCDGWDATAFLGPQPVISCFDGIGLTLEVAPQPAMVSSCPLFGRAVPTADTSACLYDSGAPYVVTPRARPRG
jgi:hypothetical protein